MDGVSFARAFVVLIAVDLCTMNDDAVFVENPRMVHVELCLLEEMILKLSPVYKKRHSLKVAMRS